MENLGGGCFLFFNFVFFLEEGRMSVRGELIIMCEEVLFLEANVCKKKIMEGSCM
jgi:hypothetical protein